jgi:glycosyltransferase involved in cell wall biosynthesis
MNDKPQRVLLLSEIFPPKTGGSGRWFHEIYSRLPSEHVVIAAGEDARAADFDAAQSLNVQRLPLTMTEWGIRNWTAARTYWSLFRQLRAIIRREQVSVVHCGRCLPEGWLAFLLKKLCGVPYISYVHGEDVESAATSRELTWMAHRILGNWSPTAATRRSCCLKTGTSTRRVFECCIPVSIRVASLPRIVTRAFGNHLAGKAALSC